MSQKQILQKTYRFIVPGKPFGYLAITGKQKWTKEYQRFARYADKVRRCARQAGVPIPLYADEEHQVVVKTIAYFPNRVHADPGNINKGVCDALFYDEDAKALAKVLGKKKVTGKGDDKQVGGSFVPPRYDKNDPRCIVIVKPYDLRRAKRNGKGCPDQDRKDDCPTKGQEKKGASDRQSRKTLRDRKTPRKKKKRSRAS